MNDLPEVISNDLADYYAMVREQTHHWVDGLSEEQIWRRPFEHGNSIGHLLLHMSGNLNYYIGAQIANTGYIRERELEFAGNHTERKDEVLRKLDEAVDIVIETLKTQTNQTWEEEYTAIGVDDVKDRFSIYLRGAVHFHHHIGQMIYLVKELSDKV